MARQNPFPIPPMRPTKVQYYGSESSLGMTEDGVPKMEISFGPYGAWITLTGEHVDRMLEVIGTELDRMYAEALAAREAAQ